MHDTELILLKLRIWLLKISSETSLFPSCSIWVHVIYHNKLKAILFIILVTSSLGFQRFFVFFSFITFFWNIFSSLAYTFSAITFGAHMQSM
jgi:hypothetical protein